MADLENEYLRTSRILESSTPVTISVRFIHIVDGAEGRITQVQREDQIRVLNECFDSMNISFAYDETEVQEIDNAAFFRMGHRSSRERHCKSQHQSIDPKSGLNFYTAAPPGSTLGWATFPYQMDGDPIMDGVVMVHSTLPHGSMERYNLGKTAVHEVGHWLGLYHTFQDGCNPPGDEVADTSPHSGANYGKPGDAEQPHNLCPSAPAGSVCPIHNFMNYVDDEWMTEFTSGQTQRVWTQLGMFRQQLLAPSPAGLDESILGQGVVW